MVIKNHFLDEQDFQIFRNNLHHDIKRDELQTILNILNSRQIDFYEQKEDYLKALYLLATVDYISKKHDIPLCTNYNNLRKYKLIEKYYVGDSRFFKEQLEPLPDFLQYNIIEGDIYDAV